MILSIYFFYLAASGRHHKSEQDQRADLKKEFIEFSKTHDKGQNSRKKGQHKRSQSMHGSKHQSGNTPK